MVKNQHRMIRQECGNRIINRTRMTSTWPLTQLFKHCDQRLWHRSIAFPFKRCVTLLARASDKSHQTTEAFRPLLLDFYKQSTLVNTLGIDRRFGCVLIYRGSCCSPSPQLKCRPQFPPANCWLSIGVLNECEDPAIVPGKARRPVDLDC